MKQFVKMITLLVVMAAGLGYGSVNAEEGTSVVGGKKVGGVGSLVETAAKETRLNGTLGEKGASLALDTPIYFAQGSRSERVVTSVRLTVPDEMRDKVMQFEHKHVEVAGPMDCTMEYSPWTATCQVTVRQIEPAR
ncbi:hypothetical protein [Geomobilimonas luticola]|uniref:Uncharacterized protein n=1 Tax=Geomobilimonas luticola TaxID=1114878 RepID=A0ABS5SEP5_9BACT|nr:hypothetical protein [Geomobilimonas luticola]MBT0653086.1 hypothetical protein [Geomobilimonas luticola]